METFPPVQGYTVNRDKRILPQDFVGEHIAVLLAFTQEHQFDVDSWLPFLLEQPHLGVYELPVLRKFTFVQRWVIDYWMDSGIADPNARERTITLYTDIDALISTLGLPADRSEIYVVLLDTERRVRCWTTGAYDAAKAEELEQVLLEETSS